MIVAEPTFTKTRNIENYLDRIQLKSKGTIKNIESYLRRFDSYLQDTYNKPNEVILDEILSMKNNQDVVLFDILQDFVNYLSGKTNRLNANTISSGYVRHTVYAIKGYLRFYGFKITSDDLKDALTLPRIVEEEREPLTREQLHLILNNQTGLRRVLYLVMSSSGMRPSEVLQIRKCDLELEKYERILVKIPAKITKTKKPRITFISKEAEKELLPYLKKINGNSFIFNPSNKTMEQIRLSELQIFGRLREKIGLSEKYESGIFHVSLGDSLRSWFVTKCNRVDYGFGHALAGHDQYMKRYDRLTLEDKIELYLKAEKSLQVFEYLDDDKEKKIQELEQKYEITNKKLELVLNMIENSQKNKSQIVIGRKNNFDDL
ncbi:tyrosine-type recombinase/integrase [Candidatus Nitrosopumilus sediminis]|uniref:Integrase family protein n=1 Tax=Candidatus Nitrosopumilus sediminis TaxID=1229909 RepID=K0BE04_9ARCH|nr:site-specific integrase [Candidatus Nitrosopumilus sediminis]AFS82566.1 integrase family protein [Candidatus Nitrosopumilus sediminis]